MGRWSELLGDLLDMIDGQLILYHDKVRIRTVCMSWNSQLSKLPNQQARKLPWLLLHGTNDIEEASSHTLFDPSEKKFHNLYLPEASKALVKGSSRGWIVTINDVNSTNPSEIYLINPLTRSRVRLPPRSAFPDVKDYNPHKVGQEYTLILNDTITYPVDTKTANILLRKVVFSSTPNCDDCIVVAICGEFSPGLTFCKCNDDKWTPLNLPSSFPKPFTDILFHEQKLYAMDGTRQILIIENIGLNPQAMVIINSPSFRVHGHAQLAELSDGDLMIVSRFYDFCEDSNSFVTDEFKLYKPDFSTSSWVKVENLGEDNILFMGIGSIISVSSHDFPGLKGNCIYYTDSCYCNEGSRHKPGSSDTGVFMFDKDDEEEMFEDMPGLTCDHKFFWPPPVWLYPA